MAAFLSLMVSSRRFSAFIQDQTQQRLFECPPSDLPFVHNPCPMTKVHFSPGFYLSSSSSCLTSWSLSSCLLLSRFSSHMASTLLACRGRFKLHDFFFLSLQASGIIRPKEGLRENDCLSPLFLEEETSHGLFSLQVPWQVTFYLVMIPST